MSHTAAIQDLLGIQHPIIQAPMAGVSTPSLAAAVCNAGALGSISIGTCNTQEAREMIIATRARTNRPFNVNVFCHRKAQADPAREKAWLTYLRPFFTQFATTGPSHLREIYPSFLEENATLQMLLEERPAIVSFHFGLPPAATIAALHAANIVTLASATTPIEAAQIEAAGVKVIIAQGMEAGGHRGLFAPEQGDAQLSTFTLVRLIARQSHLPIIAAGGIMDGTGIAAALTLGAAAAQLGTAFILSPESAANTAYRDAVQSIHSQHTQITRVISGRPARGIINRMYTEVDQESAPPVPDYPIAYDAGKALAAAASKQGNYDFAAQWAGQGAPLARALPAAELVALLVQEWQASR